MRISDWSSDVCSSDLIRSEIQKAHTGSRTRSQPGIRSQAPTLDLEGLRTSGRIGACTPEQPSAQRLGRRSEEHTSELQSIMRISYAVFCLTKKTITIRHYKTTTQITKSHNRA